MIALLKFIIEAISLAALVFVGFVAVHANLARVVGAFIVGFLGSVAYVTALYFKFIGLDDRNRSIILKPFYVKEERISLKKAVWYGFMGGAIASVFQYDVPNFVAIQSLILGVTWPMIVSMFLSGRLASPTKEEEETSKLLEKVAQGSPVNEEAAREIDETIKAIRAKKKSGGRIKGNVK